MVTKTVKKKAPTKKEPAKKSTNKENLNDIKPEILQTTKCKTVSGKATLTYHVGVDTEGKLYIRIASCSGGGYFSKEFVDVDEVKTALENIPDGSPITSLYLAPVFVGKSSNNAGFLQACLINEGVLAPFEGKKRHYVYLGFEKFLAKVKKRKATKAVS
jgi:hypothetical protein